MPSVLVKVERPVSGLALASLVHFHLSQGRGHEVVGGSIGERPRLAEGSSWALSSVLCVASAA